MRVTSSLRDEAQRQAATEVVLGEVRRLGVQGGGMVHSLDMVERTVRAGSSGRGTLASRRVRYWTLCAVRR